MSINIVASTTAAKVGELCTLVLNEDSPLITGVSLNYGSESTLQSLLTNDETGVTFELALGNCPYQQLELRVVFEAGEPEDIDFTVEVDIDEKLTILQEPISTSEKSLANFEMSVLASGMQIVVDSLTAEGGEITVSPDAEISIEYQGTEPLSDSGSVRFWDAVSWREISFSFETEIIYPNIKDSAKSKDNVELNSENYTWVTYDGPAEVTIDGGEFSYFDGTGFTDFSDTDAEVELERTIIKVKTTASSSPNTPVITNLFINGILYQINIRTKQMAAKFFNYNYTAKNLTQENLYIDSVLIPPFQEKQFIYKSENLIENEKQNKVSVTQIGTDDVVESNLNNYINHLSNLVVPSNL